MILYVESNFVLQLVWRQEAFTDVRLLLDMARNKAIDLAIPAFALFEPAWTIGHRKFERQQLVEEMGRQVREVRRSSNQQHAAQAISDAVDQFQSLDVIDRESFEDALVEVIGAGRVIPMDASTVHLALIDQYKHDLPFLDAAIWACVRQDLESRASVDQRVFVTTDKKAFNNQEIKSELAALSCSLVFSFKQATDLIQGTTNWDSQ